ncbi:histone deacetylase-like protein [Thermochaetoides thermophila DSM 1495]|uniref:Histone deacetylase-like protein n=1 Tax=Chaetomium thermophilum (strain DSM 1495 / CBS 144.50 / IMI 039719) TaxID=759272 RepID=G0RZU2_CHATD|nr:histone deacetylase-like protein [Thermochaetoides thermophila DSM 1495]EGS23720.1 histone deacetylase-like protein [Thermochaetoides thermophila DSM 1495]
MGQAPSFAIDPDTPPLTLKERSLNAVAEFIKSGRARRIVVMTGAGISTAAGIPDFRSPDTGLYSNLMDLDLPEPEAIFDIEYFRTNPKPFYVLAKELYPGRYHPTISHVFISLLGRKGLLHMLFTQNIDCLERAAGIPPELIVEAHGSFATQRCIVCKAPFDDVKMKEFVSQAKVPHCEEEGCNGLVKPDITFFGEALPRKFYENIDYARTADLVIVMVGNFGSRADDVMLLMDCDKGVRDLANALGVEG